MSHEYSAPCSRGLKVATLCSAPLLCAVPVLGRNFGPHQWRGLRVFTLLIPLFALPLGTLIVVRGYRATAAG
jgi:hypothetical protein